MCGPSHLDPISLHGLIERCCLFPLSANIVGLKVHECELAQSKSDDFSVFPESSSASLIGLRSMYREIRFFNMLLNWLDAFTICSLV